MIIPDVKEQAFAHQWYVLTEGGRWHYKSLMPRLDYYEVEAALAGLKLPCGGPYTIDHVNLLLPRVRLIKKTPQPKIGQLIVACLEQHNRNCGLAARHNNKLNEELFPYRNSEVFRKIWDEYAHTELDPIILMTLARQADDAKVPLHFLLTETKDLSDATLTWCMCAVAHSAEFLFNNSYAELEQELPHLAAVVAMRILLRICVNLNNAYKNPLMDFCHTSSITRLYRLTRRVLDICGLPLNVKTAATAVTALTISQHDVDTAIPFVQEKPRFRQCVQALATYLNLNWGA